MTHTRTVSERITAATEEAFHLRFLAQGVVPDAHLVTLDGVPHLIDVVSGSVATLTTDGPEAFTLRADGDGQRLLHSGLPRLRLPVG